MNLTHPSVRRSLPNAMRQGLLRHRCAYVLATAWHEPGAYKYVREIWGATPAQKRV